MEPESRSGEQSRHLPFQLIGPGTESLLGEVGFGILIDRQAAEASVDDAF